MKLRRTAIIAAVALIGTTVTAQQGQVVDYVITPRIFSIALDGSGETVLLGGTTMRTQEGGRALINLVNREATDGTKLVVVPSDLGRGRVGLRVEFSLLRAGQTVTAKFDVLSGEDAQRATIALTDATGKFILDSTGRPLYATFDAVRNRR